jgi:hypothetical protein
MGEASTKTEPRLLKSGAPAHNFTPEDRSKGGKASAEARRKKAASHAERIREWLESDDYKVETAIFKAISTLAKDGDVRAAELLLNRAYGTPAKAEPEEIDVTMSSDSRSPVSLSQINALAASLGIEANGKVDASNPD